MKNKKKKENKYLDNSLSDSQKTTLLKIEAGGCRLAFWGLLISLVLQMSFNNHSWRNLIGETVVFLLLDVFIIMSCLKKGIWDKNLKPNLKTNAIMSFIISTVIGLVFFYVGLKYSIDTYTALTNALIIFSISFVCFVAGFTIYALVARKKLQEVEEEAEAGTELIENSTESDLNKAKK